LEAVKNKLLLLEDECLLYPAWVELQVETESYIYELDEQLNKLIVQRPFIGRLFTRQIKKQAARNLDEQVTDEPDLTDLTPSTVFLKRCATDYPEGDHSDLLQTFEEALERLAQKEAS